MMRMERLNRRQKNTLNQEAVRARTDLSMLSWFPRATKFVINARLDGLLRSLTVAQIAANTTRGSTPAFLVLPASKGNHKLSPRMPTPITTLGTSAKNQKPQPGSGYIPGAGCEEANEDKLVNRNVNLHGALQGEERQSQARLYEGSNEEPYNFGRYQREANGREVGGKRAEYKINGSNGFTPGAEMLPPVLYNPSFLSVSGLEWGHGSSRGGPLWSSSREENDRSSQVNSPSKPTCRNVLTNHSSKSLLPHTSPAFRISGLV